MIIRTLILCGIMLTMLAGCGKAKENYEQKFKESFKQSFVKSCTESAVKGGAKEGDARSKCDCVASYLVNKYSSVELLKLTNTESLEGQKILGEAINSCK